MEDIRLIEAVLAGERDAFGPLMDQHYAMVYRLCFNMTGNVPDAEELAHDSFVEAYIKLGQLRELEKFSGWLKMIALNVCRMWYRQNQHKTVELVEDQVSVVEDDTEDSSIYSRMSYGLATLSAPHRLVLALHYYEGLSYDEVATFLEVPNGTVMSRLHRARQALKEVMEQMTDFEEIPDIPDDKFKEIVQAEIAVLLKMFNNESNAPERLTVVLKKSPQRLVELVADADTSEMLRNIAILLSHLGPESMDNILDCCFSNDEIKISKALELLQVYASRCGTIPQREGMQDMASKESYLLLDRLFVHSASDKAKAEILVEMMDACQESAPALLYANALMCYQAEAFPILMDRYLSQSSKQPSRILHALIRTGARFIESSLELIWSGSYEKQVIGLIGCEAIAKSLSPTGFIDISTMQFQNDLRTHEKWPPLKSEEIGDTLLEDMTRMIALFAQNGPSDLRSQAVRILGHVKADEYRDLIKGFLLDADQTVRIAAIFALSEIGDTSSADMLMNCAREGGSPEKIAAITALGRLQIVSSEHLLVEMISDSDDQVRESAVTALGELGSVSSQVALQGLLHGTDRKLQKAAANALFGGVTPRKREMSDVQRRLAEKRRKVSPVALISPDAVMRFGLTEIRSYDENELTECIARVCLDYCATRRYMVELGLMTRANGIYEFTENGKQALRVEKFIYDRYLMLCTGQVSAAC